MNETKDFLRGVSASLASLKMYPATHPQAKVILEKTFADLQSSLQDRQELIVGFVEDEIVLEKEVLFDLSVMLKLFITQVKDRKIEKIYFTHGLQYEEFTQFVVLLSSKDTLKSNLQDLLQARGVANIRVGAMTTPDKKDESPKLTQQQTYENLLTQLTTLFKQLADDVPADENVYVELKFAVFNILENLLGNYQSDAHLEVAKNFDPVVVHSLNVSLLSMYFSLRLGFVHDHVLETGLAAMVHDLGRFYLARRREKLGIQDKELGSLPLHTILGAEFILRYVDKFGPLSVIVALEHHRPYKLKVGRERTYPQEAHLISRIVRICDMYDTILQRRSATQNYAPKDIYNFMLRGSDLLFQRELLGKFFKVVGIWPRGTIVELSDGKIAIVREANEDNPTAPKVELIDGPKGQLLDLRAPNSATIVSHLNPFAEGSEYVSYI